VTQRAPGRRESFEAALEGRNRQYSALQNSCPSLRIEFEKLINSKNTQNIASSLFHLFLITSTPLSCCNCFTMSSSDTPFGKECSRMMEEIDEAIGSDSDGFSRATSMAGVTENETDAGSVCGQGDHSRGTTFEEEGR
jgi:hypothetical protein